MKTIDLAHRAACAWLVGGLLLAAPVQPTRAADTPAIPVVTASAERRSIARSFEFVGRVEAPERVDVRARVKGVLEEVLFKEGDTIKAGTPLYRIEKSLFEADVKQAQGALERGKAELALAGIQRDRAEELLKRNAGTAVAFDQAVAQEAQAKGATTSAEANLETTKINLGYTDIVAPITGRIGRTVVTKGNIVGPESGVLTSLVSQDPMHVTFPISQRDIMAAKKAGQVDDVKAIKVQIRFSDGTLYNQVGQINFIDVSVDRSTDTVVVRADIANPAGTLIDGQLVKVELQAGAPQERVLVPQAALLADQQGTYLFIVDDGKAAVKRVKTEGAQGADSIVASGLDGGELVIVDGFQSLRPGMAVRATPAPTLRTGG
ncbi:efflux RND transporter periplasmic adaptor subunit [Bosea caraganae]|uniref:Efflux RND transporter periplasmic adaptor subunit n=1 Tax=Bosea caraganae TaxID=2763117 RepID=A0A370LBP1_9HYPH|nr:efflux RND transporter periplasmic adaptor subunit [Bosea caraganae]RDJ27244.1 efflux RND transporter periplasmic adaptor subunit [Bosea caraganae]RDJ29260.1 efflux RND transporter periplasmic adaptor subunit [Bosea caraganae]